MIFVRERRIRFSDCDPAGIVFYPQYFVMFNGLVEDWIEDELGIRYAELVLGRGTGLPSVRLEADFKAVSHLGDPVALTLAVERIGNSSLTLNLRCVGRDNGDRNEDDVRMTLRQVIVTTDLKHHKAIPIPPDLRAAISRFAGEN
jgi:4-hydroxybenzoyl-CoA thioesterase